MNVYKWLEQVRKLDELINAKIAERDRLIALATDVSAKPMDGMPYSNTGTVSQRMQNAVMNLIMLEQELGKIIDKYVDYKQEVVKVLEKLPDKEYGVLHRHYIRYMTWEQVAEDMGYSTTQVWRIKKNGLKILQHVIECNA
jgi:DNA-directed RNA polymerase specialized sigma subunit